MAHERRGAPVEQERGQLRDHRSANVLFAHQWTVDELAAIEPVRDHATLLETGEEGGDGGLREIAVRPQPFLHFEHRRLVAIPEDAHDRELEVRQ